MNAKTGKAESAGAGPVSAKWKDLAGYTSQEKPMYLYHEGLHYYAVIGDKAYALDPEMGGRIEAVDSFIFTENGKNENILKE